MAKHHAASDRTEQRSALRHQLDVSACTSTLIFRNKVRNDAAVCSGRDVIAQLDDHVGKKENYETSVAEQPHINCEVPLVRRITYGERLACRVCKIHEEETEHVDG